MDSQALSANVSSQFPFKQASFVASKAIEAAIVLGSTRPDLLEPHQIQMIAQWAKVRLEQEKSNNSAQSTRDMLAKMQVAL